MAPKAALPRHGAPGGDHSPADAGPGASALDREVLAALERALQHIYDSRAAIAAAGAALHDAVPDSLSAGTYASALNRIFLVGFHTDRLVDELLRDRPDGQR